MSILSELIFQFFLICTKRHEMWLLSMVMVQCFILCAMLHSANLLFSSRPHLCECAKCHVAYQFCSRALLVISMKQEWVRERGQCGPGQQEMFMSFYSHGWHPHTGQRRAEDQQHLSFRKLRWAVCSKTISIHDHTHTYTETWTSIDFAPLCQPLWFYCLKVLLLHTCCYM